MPSTIPSNRARDAALKEEAITRAYYLITEELEIVSTKFKRNPEKMCGANSLIDNAFLDSEHARELKARPHQMANMCVRILSRCEVGMSPTKSDQIGILFKDYRYRACIPLSKLRGQSGGYVESFVMASLVRVLFKFDIATRSELCEMR